MTSVGISRHIAATGDVVFPLLSDIERAPDVYGGIVRVEMLTPGPVGVGTRWRETRRLFGREAVEELTISAFDAGRGYTVEARSHGAHYLTTIACQPAGDGTAVTMTFTVRPLSFIAKLMQPLAPLMLGSVKKALAQDLTDLAAAAEGRAGARPGVGAPLPEGH